MKKATQIGMLALAGICHGDVVQASNAGAHIFGAEVTSECDNLKGGTEESAAAAVAWAAKFAVKAVVGLASSAVDAATKAGKETFSAKARGQLYDWYPDSDSPPPATGAWAPVRSLCIRFWRASLAENREQVAQANYGVDDTLTDRWRRLAFTEAPYAYGEVQVSLDQKNNVLGLDPVLLYARLPPEASGFWRKAGVQSVAIELSVLGSEKPFATHAVDLPGTNNGAALLRNTSIRGLGSGWFSMPEAPPAPKFAKGESQVASGGHFTALVTMTSASSASLVGEALSTTFKDQKEGLVEALTPKSRAERALQHETAILAAFDALAAVVDAETALSTNTDATMDAKLRLALRKAQYLADLRLQAAGLPRYGISAP